MLFFAKPTGLEFSLSDVNIMNTVNEYSDHFIYLFILEIQLPVSMTVVFTNFWPIIVTSKVK